MNVPDYIWERISGLLDLGIVLILINGAIFLIVLVGVVIIFAMIIKKFKEAKRISEENRKKAEEFERDFREHKEEIKEHRKKHFSDD